MCFSDGDSLAVSDKEATGYTGFCGKGHEARALFWGLVYPVEPPGQRAWPVSGTVPKDTGTGQQSRWPDRDARPGGQSRPPAAGPWTGQSPAAAGPGLLASEHGAR